MGQALPWTRADNEEYDLVRSVDMLWYALASTWRLLPVKRWQLGRREGLKSSDVFQGLVDLTPELLSEVRGAEPLLANLSIKRNDDLQLGLDCKPLTIQTALEVQQPEQFALFGAACGRIGDGKGLLLTRELKPSSDT